MMTTDTEITTTRLGFDALMKECVQLQAIWMTNES